MQATPLHRQRVFMQQRPSSTSEKTFGTSWRTGRPTCGKKSCGETTTRSSRQPRSSLGPAHHFQATGLKPEHWRTAAPIRAIFRKSFTAAGLRYFNPHSVRNTLVSPGEAQCQTPEQFKAWSQNLRHEGVLTTFTSYGAAGNNRQREIIGNLGKRPHSQQPTAEEIAKAVALLGGSE